MLLGQVLRVHHNGRPDLFLPEGRKYTRPELIDIIADASRPVFVCTNENDTVVAYAFCMIENYAGSTSHTPIRTLYVDDICVDENARGKHLGSALYEYVIDYARKEGFYNVTLNVWTSNPGAVAFYEAMGMTPYRIGMETVL